MLWKRHALLALLALVLPSGFAAAALPGVHQGDGAVFTMSNDADANTVVVLHRAEDGGLTLLGEVATGGVGSGAGLGNQGALALDADRGLLFVVNAGSDDVSVLANGGGGTVRVADVEPSGGTVPVSVTVHDDLVYVLNAGDGGSIAGFWLDGTDLVPIDGSIRSLSADVTAPAQIGFDPYGQTLVVTEKATNRITTFAVDGATGLPDHGHPHDSSGVTPFGFDFDPLGRLFVSEAFGGAPLASTLSSYAVGSDALLDPITASAPNHQTAACWALVTGDGRFVYVTNTGTNTISGYTIAADGSVELLDDDGVTAPTGDGPIDMAFSRDERYLYALNGRGDSISAFALQADGSLVPLGEIDGLPAAVNGLAGF
jgi:6-phosphogluconolactonase (cycloisomerase 2 family)